MKNYGNKVLHCGVTRTGTTVVRYVFEKLVERLDLDIETVNTGHKLFPKEYTKEQRKEPVLGRVLITRDPFHMLNSMKNTFMNPTFKDVIEYDIEVMAGHLGRVLNQIVEFSNHGIHNDGFVLMLRYESFLPNNLDYLVWFFHDYLKVFSEQKLIPEFEPFTKNQMVEFQKEIVEEFSIKNQLKRIKHLKTYNDMEEKYELHGNHISSKDGYGSINSLSGSERVFIMEEYSWFLKEFGYMPIQAHSVGFG